MIWKGKMKISKNRILEGKRARIIGIVALIPAVIDFGSIFAGIRFESSAGDVVALITWIAILAVLIGVLSLSKKISSDVIAN